MPMEMRRLVFRETEVVQALTLLVQAEAQRIRRAAEQDTGARQALPDLLESVQSIHITQDDPLEILATVVTPKGRKTQRLFQTKELIFCLVSYCRGKKIPVSRSAGKTLRRAKVGIALDLILRDWTPQGAAAP